MTRYEGPSLAKDIYSSKFVRVGERIHVTEPGDTGTRHDDLAKKDGILEEIARLQRDDPTALDAGQFTIFTHPSGNEVTVHQDSSSLRLPMTREARDNTIAEFAKQTPGYTVKKDYPPTIYQP